MTRLSTPTMLALLKFVAHVSMEASELSSASQGLRLSHAVLGRLCASALLLFQSRCPDTQQRTAKLPERRDITFTTTTTSTVRLLLLSSEPSASSEAHVPMAAGLLQAWAGRHCSGACAQLAAGTLRSHARTPGFSKGFQESVTKLQICQKSTPQAPEYRCMQSRPSVSLGPGAATASAPCSSAKAKPRGRSSRPLLESLCFGVRQDLGRFSVRLCVENDTRAAS